MQRILALGTSGLTKADLSLRLYTDATRSSTLEDAIVVDEEGTSGDYALTLPSDRGFYSLTHEYPTGVTGTLRFGGYDVPSLIPQYIVIGHRTTGLVLADIDAAVYLNGVLRADVLALAELVTGLGDYALSGWPTTRDNAYAGTWTVRYSIGGLTYSVSWQVPITPTSTFILELLDLFLDEVIAIPGTTNEYNAFTPSGTLLALPCRIEGEQRLVRDPSGQEITTSVIVIVAGYYHLTTDLHRYLLPARYTPDGSESSGAGIRAIYIDKVSSDLAQEEYEEIGFA